MCNYFNKSWLAFTGRTMEQEVGEGWAEGVHPDDYKDALRIYTDAFEKREPFEMEYRLKRSDGQYRWIHDFGRPFYGLKDEFMGYIGSCYDITQSKEYTEKIEFMAEHDPLTGVANRRGFQESLERSVARAARGHKSALLFIDIDHFKNVNDEFGHVAGDNVLRELTETMKLWLRKEDLLARVGGDEFAALLDGEGIDEAVMVAERMRKAIEGYKDSSWDFSLSLSIGVAEIDGAAKADEVLGFGDRAMYEAKQAGRNRVKVFAG
jgi:diguanylate cyclase (GGDEF)-like protein/PAS domain S-box-containing protein